MSQGARQRGAVGGRGGALTCCHQTGATATAQAASVATPPQKQSHPFGRTSAPRNGPRRGWARGSSRQRGIADRVAGRTGATGVLVRGWIVPCHGHGGVHPLEYMPVAKECRDCPAARGVHANVTKHSHHARHTPGAQRRPRWLAPSPGSRAVSDPPPACRGRVCCQRATYTGRSGRPPGRGCSPSLRARCHGLTASRAISGRATGEGAATLPGACPVPAGGSGGPQGVEVEGGEAPRAVAGPGCLDDRLPLGA